MFENLFIPSHRIDVALASLRQNAREWAQTEMKTDAQSDWFLKNVGLWP